MHLPFRLARARRVLAAIAVGAALAGAADYTYPLYPFAVDPSQCWMFKVMFENPGMMTKNADTVMQFLRRVDNLSRGLPKIPILVGWQQGGHDWQYPAWYGPVNPKIKRPQDPSARESLLWLTSEAVKYHSHCTVHTNTYDANGSNAAEYALFDKSGWLCRKADGSYVTTNTYIPNYLNHIIDLAKEWDDGHLRKRADTLIATLPFLKDTKILYCDNQTQWYDCAYTHDGRDRQIEAIKDLATYLRQRYGIDMIGESFEPEVYGMNSLWLNVYYNTDPMQIPAYVMAAGRGYGYDDRTNDLGAIFGGGSQMEQDVYHTNPDAVMHDVALYVAPYQYMNRLLRDDYDAATHTLKLSEGVVSYKDTDGQYKMRKGDAFLRIGDDICIPAVWKSHRELIAYRGSGQARTWTLPAEWSDVGAVDVYHLLPDGPVAVKRNVAVPDHKLTLDNVYPTNVTRGYAILPAGTDPAEEHVIPPSGTIAFAGIDSATHGSWKGVYGSEGFYIAGDSSRAPAYGNWAFRLGTEAAWAASTSDPRALQKAGDPGDRIAARRYAKLHEGIDIDVGSSPRDFALYLMEWGTDNVQMAVDVLDANDRLLDSRLVDRINKGIYLKYTITGKVRFRLTKFYRENFGNPGGTPIFSGFFFGGAATSLRGAARARGIGDPGLSLVSFGNDLKVGLTGAGSYTVSIFGPDGALARREPARAPGLLLSLPPGAYAVTVREAGCRGAGCIRARARVLHGAAAR